MLQISNLSKSYGSRTLLEGVTLQMGPGERLGLVGRNGHGKSTLIKMILGEENYDQGHLTFPKNYQVGHLAQHINFTMPTVLAEAALGLKEEERDHLYKVEAILFGLGFTKEDLSKSPNSFSGGYQIRINLTKVLVADPDLLLLDEPTNYLDIISIRWLGRFLRQWKGELIIISHDRDFMDSVTTHTAMIHRTKIKKIPGNTQKIFEQIAVEEEVYEKTRVNEDKKRKDIEDFVNRFRAQANKATLVQSRIKLLEKMPSRDELADIQSLGLTFPYQPIAAKQILELSEISFGYEGMTQKLIENFSLSVKNGEKIAIIGKNGKGKSTLLNLMSGVLTPLKGEVRPHVNLAIGHFGQTNIARLNSKITVEEEISSANTDLSKTHVRSICGSMMFTQDDALKKISVLSGGEKSRVLLGKILAKNSNILFLDEPTNHLDMDSIAALVESLKEFAGAVVIVTHSEMILRELPTKFVVFQADGPKIFEGSYEEFLSKVGWSEEINDETETSESQPLLSRKEMAHRKAQLVKERSRLLNPLKMKCEKLEKEIITLEALIEENNHKIIDFASSGKKEAIAELSIQSKKAKDSVEKLFQELEVAMNEMQKIQEKFDIEIKEME
ncbi:MAG: ATP-binding cassette domain-containing protein [Bacteriovoracaceae bacterium]|nr:ATP-binding cassette domain-containing protein [Bacteriovoracaceae bacterium]